MNLKSLLLLVIVLYYSASHCNGECKTNRFFFHCLNGSGCFPRGKVCDSINDCSDRSDEQNCVSRNNAASYANYNDYFRCNKGRILPQTQFCDGIHQCGSTDTSDEDYCICEAHQFKCNSTALSCVDLNLVCNGRNDCADGSDENSSICYLRKCTTSEFQCTNKRCVPKEKTCDSRNDCGDASDEDIDLCTCNYAPKESTCKCPTGHRVEPVSYALHLKTCVDIDECVEIPGICDHICMNEAGSFKCSCQSHYFLKSDNRSCGMEGFAASILYEWNSSIMLATSDLSYHKQIASHNSLSAFAIDAHLNSLYWSSAADRIIVRQNIVGGKPGSFEIVVRGLNQPTLLAYDWISINVFVVDETDTQDLVIKVCNMKVPGMGCASIIPLQNNPEEFNVTGIACAPQEGFIFWTQVTGGSQLEVNETQKGAIWRGRMDGSAVTILTEQIQSPVGLALDHVFKRIYWIDSGTKTVEGMNFDGSNRTVVVNLQSTSLGRVHGLAIYENHVTWIEGEFFKCRVNAQPHNGTGNCSILNKPLSVAKFPTILHPVMQPIRNEKEDDPCASNPCSFICVGIGSISNRNDNKSHAMCNATVTSTFKCFCPDELFSADESNSKCLKEPPLVETTVRELITEQDSPQQSTTISPREEQHARILDLNTKFITASVSLSIFTAGIVLIFCAGILLSISLVIYRKKETQTELLNGDKSDSASTNEEMEFQYVPRTGTRTKYLL